VSRSMAVPHEQGCTDGRSARAEEVLAAARRPAIMAGLLGLPFHSVAGQVDTLPRPPRVGAVPLRRVRRGLAPPR
jgi:hypothetical protein